MRERWIAVCDDQIECANLLRDIIIEICEKMDINIQTNIYVDGKSLLNHLEGCSIAFLDIDMPEMDGIELGKRIKEREADCKLIMATGREDRYKDAFTIQALRFVTKPFDYDEIKEALVAALMKSVQDLKVEVYKNRIMYEIRQSDIMYIRAYNGYIEIITSNNKFRKDSSLDAFLAELEKEVFVKIHKAYIINLNWIDEIRKNFVVIGVHEIPVSRRNRTILDQKYIEFDLKFRC